MLARMILTITGALTLLFSAPVPAHITEPGAVLPHILTGEHLLILVIVGVCVAGISRLHGRNRK
ncbi:MAG: hypothetical protein WBS20_11180 [Lysobacterales bacterium]